MSSATTFPPATVNAATDTGRPSTTATDPAIPLTSAGLVYSANRAKVTAPPATACAPRTSTPGYTAPPSERATTFAEGPARNKALGLWGSLSGIASIVGVMLGGVLADGPGWEWIFWINVPVGLGAALIAPRIVPESGVARRDGPFDAAGAVALTGGLLLLVFTLGEATHVGWAELRTVGGLAWVAALLVLGTFGALFYFASIFMQEVYGYSPLEAGFAYVPLAVSVAVGAGIASGLIAKVAAKPVLVTGLLLTITGLLLLWRAPADGSYPVHLLPAFLLLGVGCGLVFVTLQIAAFVGIGEAEAGVGAGLYNTSQETGAALGLAVVSTIAYDGMTSELAATGGDPALVRDVQEAANHDAFLSAAGMGFLGLLVVLFLMPRAKRTPEPAADTGGTPGEDTGGDITLTDAR